MLRPLSPRERDVLQRLAAGDSLKAAARVLSISIDTAKDRAAAARLKLGAKTSAQAAAIAARAGLL